MAHVTIVYENDFGENHLLYICALKFMESEPRVSFEDTAVAFAYKSTRDLQKANFIFSLVNHPWISAMATGFVKLAFKARLPIKGIIKETAFDHFCGGESIERSQAVIKLLGDHNVGTILDYSVEGEKSEPGFDVSMQEILRSLEKAHYSRNIPFCVFKVTGLASTELLEKVSAGEALSPEEDSAVQRAWGRVDRICGKAHAYGVPVLIDAEETWIQDAIDQMADVMMARYNREKAIVFNTYQMYLTRSMDNLIHDYQDAFNRPYFLGAKLVRGAYMEKERKRAQKNNSPSPIHVDKTATDNAFNEALKFCVDHIDRVSVMCGSHNELSNALLTKWMDEKGLPPGDRRVWFAQLYGMSDNISFNLAKLGYNVAKYVPYGPVETVMPYLLRRAQENTSVAGQSSRELRLIRKELKRRRRGG